MKDTANHYSDFAPRGTWAKLLKGKQARIMLTAKRPISMPSK